MYTDYWRVKWQPSGSPGGRTGSVLRFIEPMATGQQVDTLKVNLDGQRPPDVFQMRGGAYQTGVPLETQIAQFLATDPTAIQIDRTKLKPGEYHPRVWRQRYASDLYLRNTHEFASTIQAVSNLFLQGTDVYRFIEPYPSNNLVFGHRIREVLILACTEVEAAWKAILLANNKISSTDRVSTTQYVDLLPVLRLGEWEIALANYPHYPPFKPFGGWSAAAPTQSLPWYDAYNKVKHDREANFASARLDHMIMALGACYVMLRAQFGEPATYAHDAHYPVPFSVVGEPAWPLADQYIPAYPFPGQSLTWTPIPF